MKRENMKAMMAKKFPTLGRTGKKLVTLDTIRVETIQDAISHRGHFGARKNQYQI